MDGLFEVQDSALNSSLADILASMAEAEAAAADAPPASNKSAGGGGGGDGRAANSPLLGEHEILSNSLQEFLKYDDPHSPIIPALELSHGSHSGSATAEVPTSSKTPTASSRSPRFTVHRTPSFTPSLKGFLFSKDDGVVGRIETTTACSLTSGSGSESSDPRTYLPRLTDGSVSVLHSIENDLQDLSSLDDSMRSDEDTSSSNDREKPAAEVVDLGSVKAELDKNFGVRLHHDRVVLGSPTPAPPVNFAKDAPSDVSSSRSPTKAALQRLVEAFDESKQPDSSSALPNEATPSNTTKSGPSLLSTDGCASASREVQLPYHVGLDHPEQTIDALSSAPAAPIEQPAHKPTSELPSTEPEPFVVRSTPPPPPGAIPIQQSSQRTTPEPQSTTQIRLPPPTQHEPPSPVPSKPSPTTSNAARPPRRSSMGNDHSARSPTASSPCRRTGAAAATTTRRRSLGSSSSSRRRGSPPPTAPSLSPGAPKHRSKSSPRTKDMKGARATAASPSMVCKKICLVSSQAGETDSELTTVPCRSSKAMSEMEPAKAPKSPTLSVSRTVELPAAPGAVPKSPKSPHRELRLKIQIDELRSPNHANDGRDRGREGAEDEALPQMLKMLLDGVANKIRKHAKQESLRKIRTRETSNDTADVESPARSARHAASAATRTEPSGSPKQRIKVRIDKSKTSSPRKDGTSTSLSPSKSGRRRVAVSKADEETNDFDPHSVGKSGCADDHRARRDPSQSSRRHKEQSSEERSRSRSSKPDHGKHHREEDWNPHSVSRPESATERPRRSVERGASSRRMSGGARHDERLRSKSSAEDRQHRSSRSRSKASSTTTRTEALRSDESHEKTAPLKARLDEEANRSSRASGSRSVCSMSSRKRRDGSHSEEKNDSSHHRSRKSSDSDAKASSLASTLERSEKKKIGASSSRSVCSRSSRKHKEGADEKRLSHSYHSKSVHSCSKSVHSSSRSVHSASKASSKSRNEATLTVDVDRRAPSMKSSASSHGRSEATEAIEYDFNDDPPQMGAESDRQGRSYRRGSGSSSARGRSQSSRRLRSEQDSSLAKTGRSQSQRHIPSDRPSSLSSSRRSQSHRHLKSGEPEYQLGLGLESHAAKGSSSRSSSQPPASSRHARPESARAESIERSGARRSRSRPASSDSRKGLSLSGLSRSQLEEGAKSVASSASDRTPRRSGGRGPSPNARSRNQPTSLLGPAGKAPAPPTHHQQQQAPEPPGRSPVVQSQVATTVSRLRGVHKALSFRELFGRDADPWQEFTSPTRQPKPSCLPVVGTIGAAAPAPAGTTASATTKGGRSMPKFLSAVGSSFQRSASARFPEVSKAELDASFESFHPFEGSSRGVGGSGGGGPESDKPSTSSSSASSSTVPAPPLSGGPAAPPSQPSASERSSGQGWTQKFFR